MRKLAFAIALLVGGYAFGADVRAPAPAQNTDTTVGSTALGALNAACTIALQGNSGVLFQLDAGTLAATIQPEYTSDGGTTWTNGNWIDPTAFNWVQTATLTNPNAVTIRLIAIPGGSQKIRVRVASYTSGTANCHLAATTASNADFLLSLLVGTAGGTFPPTIIPVGMWDGSAIQALRGTTSGGTVLFVGGVVANNVAPSGNPLPISAIATALGSAPSTVTSTRNAAVTVDTNRRLLVNTNHPNNFSCKVDNVSANTQCVGLSGASLSYWITDFYCSDSTTASNLQIVSSTTAGNACASSPTTVTPLIFLLANGFVAVDLTTPIKATANSALCVTTSGVTAFSCQISGYIAP